MVPCGHVVLIYAVESDLVVTAIKDVKGCPVSDPSPVTGDLKTAHLCD